MAEDSGTGARLSSRLPVRRTVIPALFALLAPIIPALLIAGSQGYFGAVSDLPQYYAAARMMTEGQGALIYRLDQFGQVENRLFPAMDGRVVGLYVPPFALPYLLPLAFLPAHVVAGPWPVILSATLLASVGVLKRVFSLTLPAILWLVAVFSISGPVYESLRIGQLAPFLLLAFGAALAALKTERPAVAAAALSVLFLKPQELAPFVVYLLGAGRYRVFGWLLVWLVVLAGLSLGLVGPSGYHNYVDLIFSSVERSFGMQPELAPTIRGQLLRFMPGDKTAVTASGILACLVALGSIYTVGRKWGRGKHWLNIGLLAAMPLGLVSSLHCHDYDLVLLIPSVVAFLGSGAPAATPSWLLVPALLTVPFFLLPFYVDIHYGYLLKGGLVNPLFVGLALYAAVGVHAASKLAKKNATQGDLPAPRC